MTHTVPLVGHAASASQHMTLLRQPRMAPIARLWVRTLLADSPCLDDAEQIAGEMLCNAIVWGQWNTLAVVLTTEPGRIHLAVSDEGQPQPCSVHGEAEEYSYGLSTIKALATRWGHIRNPNDQHTLWAELINP